MDATRHSLWYFPFLYGVRVCEQGVDKFTRSLDVALCAGRSCHAASTAFSCAEGAQLLIWSGVGSILANNLNVADDILIEFLQCFRRNPPFRVMCAADLLNWEAVHE